MAALGAAVGFAVFQTVQRRALRGVDVYRATASVLVVAAVLLSTSALLTTGVGQLAAAPAGAVAAFAAAGLVHFGLGWTLLATSQVRLGAARTGVVVGTVPLFGAIVAAIALDEPLDALAVAGLVLSVVGVVVVVSRPQGRSPGAVAATASPTSPEAQEASTDGAAGETVGTVRRPRLGDAGIGLVAGLGAAACWSVSPVLIRTGLDGLPSPLLGVAVGMSACAVVYVVGLLLVRGVPRGARPRGGDRLLVLSGTAVGLAILLQWTAFDRATVAVVLAVLQLTPPLVVAMAARVAGDPLEPDARRRAWLGATMALVGALVLVLSR